MVFTPTRILQSHNLYDKSRGEAIRTSSEVILKVENVTMVFPGVKALDEFHFELNKGELHALLGENGSGKSTTIKVLGGIYKPQSGDLYMDGEKIQIHNVHDARRFGISIVHQELIFAPFMTVADNIFMGDEPVNRFGFLRSQETIRKAKNILTEFGSNIDPELKMNDLSLAQQQVVEIAKALSHNAKIMIMDEPTASLSQMETDQLFLTIDKLKKQGISIIYVSHRMDELFRLADRVTVLRDGQYIGTKNIRDTDENELVRMMVGREIGEHYRTHEVSDQRLLEVKNLSLGNRVNDVSIAVHKGEVVGISGLVGAGRTELARIIAGIDTRATGEIRLENKLLKLKNVRQAIGQGIVLVPENRKEQGLILMQTVNFNLTICVLKEFIKGLIVRNKRQYDISETAIRQLRIKVSSPDQVAGKLSGGNQQKIVIAKWLATKPKLLILDEPTRGIDVGAKSEIYQLIDQLAQNGVGIIVISSELPEILRISDSVYVMRGGRIVAHLEQKDVNEETIIRYAAGVCGS